jgi:hypothetical protein
MLVFTITNNVTEDVWVGTCKDSSDERFQQFQEAVALGIKATFYKDLRDFGVQNFTVEDYAVAHDREELRDIFDEAMDTYDGKSLTGIKTTLGKTSIATAAPLTAAAKRAMATTKTSAKGTTTLSTAATSSVKSGSKKTASVGINNRPISRKPVKEKLSSGRTGSANRERSIKEKIAEEKAMRESTKSKQIMEQADEMKAILAALDSRGSSLRKKY